MEIFPPLSLIVAPTLVWSSSQHFDSVELTALLGTWRLDTSGRGEFTDRRGRFPPIPARVWAEPPKSFDIALHGTAGAEPYAELYGGPPRYRYTGWRVVVKWGNRLPAVFAHLDRADSPVVTFRCDCAGKAARLEIRGAAWRASQDERIVMVGGRCTHVVTAELEARQSGPEAVVTFTESDTWAMYDAERQEAIWPWRPWAS